MALEALGGMHRVTIKQLKKLGSALGRQSGQEESVAISHLFEPDEGECINAGDSST